MEKFIITEIKKLIEKGYKFKTKNSDTEVLLLSYIEWGLKCVDKFRGMFAFAIWDNLKKVFLLEIELVLNLYIINLIQKN